MFRSKVIFIIALSMLMCILSACGDESRQGDERQANSTEEAMQTGMTMEANGDQESGSEISFDNVLYKKSTSASEVFSITEYPKPDEKDYFFRVVSMTANACLRLKT